MGAGMEVHVHRANVIKICDQLVFDLVSDLVPFIHAEFTIDKNGDVDHQILAEAVSLQVIDALYSWYVADNVINLLVKGFARHCVHQVIGGFG